MRRLAALAALGLAAYFAFLAATMPAAFVASMAESRSQGAVRLAEPRGTAWSGEARAAVVLATGGRIDIEALRWRWRPSALAAGRLAFDVEAAAPGLEARGEFGRTFGGMQARDVSIRTEAARLAQALPLLATWKPQGTIQVAAPRVAFDGPSLQGEATLEWRDAAVALSPVRPLGAWKLEATASAEPGKLTLTTLSGPLRLAGQGSFAWPRTLSLDGTARAEGADAAALEPLLDLIGPRRPDGARTITLRAP